MQTLYPQIKPHARHDLAVDETHMLYVDESGSPEGLPVVFIHGGPGAGCDAQSRRYFDPNLYRIVTFDQRGCGRSTPHASLENNTTWDLVADLERIRKHLGIDKWVLFGGSWGSTLALAYAQTHPERVHGLILRGIFLCRPQEIEWFYQAGASRLFPDYWQDYIAPIPLDERDDLLSAFHKRLTGNDQIAQMHAAKAWSTWEGRTATLRPNPLVVDRFSEPQRALSIARIECHYFTNNAFLEPNQLIRDMAQDRPSARRDRAWPLRRDLPAGQRLGTASELAEQRAAGDPRCRPCRVRAGHHRCPGARCRADGPAPARPAPEEA